MNPTTTRSGKTYDDDTGDFTSSTAQKSAQDTASGDPGRISGAMRSAKGNVKEGLGNISGSTRLQQQGEQERLAGQTESTAAKGQSRFTKGTGMAGKKDQMLGSTMDDPDQPARGNLRRGQEDYEEDMDRSL